MASLLQTSRASDFPSPLASASAALASTRSRVVEEGNKIADALGVVAPSHLARGAEVIRQLRVEAPAEAYGFLIANAYVVDKDSGRSFFLTAVVYANPDETMNDDTYAYDSISFPALADVAEAFCRNAFAP